MSQRAWRRGGVAMLVAVLGTWSVSTTVSGCGGDDEVPATDAGSDTGQPPQQGSNNIQIVAPDVATWVDVEGIVSAESSTSSLDGALTYAWSVKSTPPGSNAGAAALRDAQSARAGFTPDMAGDFVLEVKVSAGGESATQDVRVRGVNGHVFYVQGNGTTPPTTDMMTVEMDGRGKHAVACKQPLLTEAALRQLSSIDGGGADAQQLNEIDGGQGFMMACLLTMLFSDMAIDTYEGLPGEPPRAAFQTITAGADDASSVVSLVLATPDNTCQNPPTELRRLGGGDDGIGILQPRFSKDGQRVAFIETRPGDQYVVSTVGADGQGYRNINQYCPDPDAGDKCYKRAFGPRRPQWLDGTNLGWARSISDSEWEVVTAPDMPNAPVTRYMRCAGYGVPLSIGFLPNGEVLASVRPSKDAPEDLKVFARDGAGNCVELRNLTKLPRAGSYARDFAISPDGKTVAYMQAIAEPDAGADDGGLKLDTSMGGNLYLVPVDGTSPPRSVNTEELIANFGPRWIAGGTRLAWNGNAPPPPDFDAAAFGGNEAGSFEGGFPSMNVVKASGGPVTNVAISDPLNGVCVTGGGNGGGCNLECVGKCPPPKCSVVNRRAPIEPLGGTAAVVFALFLRRWRRKSGKRSGDRA